MFRLKWFLRVPRCFCEIANWGNHRIRYVAALPCVCQISNSKPELNVWSVRTKYYCEVVNFFANNKISNRVPPTWLFFSSAAHHRLTLRNWIFEIRSPYILERRRKGNRWENSSFDTLKSFSNVDKTPISDRFRHFFFFFFFPSYIYDGKFSIITRFFSNLKFGGHLAYGVFFSPPRYPTVNKLTLRE